MKKIIVASVLGVAVVVLAVFGRGLYAKYFKKDKGAAEQQAMPVQVVMVEQQDFYPEVSFVSKIETKDRVEVRARVTGFLTKRLFTEGEFVKEGQLLFEIEKDKFVASVHNAQANLAKAEANQENAAAQFKRAQNLFKTKDVSQAVLDQRQAEYSSAKAAVKQAQAELDIAQLNLNYTDVVAPLSGRIGATNYSVGSLIGPESGSLVSIVSIDPMYAVFSVSENQLLQMKNFWGKEKHDLIKISFVFSDGSVYAEEGQLDFVDIALDEQMNTMKMRISFVNPDNQLIAGQYGRVEMRFTEPKKAILLPSEVVLRDLAGPYVFIVNDKNMIEQRRVGKGLELSNGKTIIETGLDIGEKVLSSNLQIANRLKNVPVNPMVAPKDKKENN